MSIHQTIIKNIYHQLYLHGYLVIPNFGGFILKTMSAQISFNGAVISPPTKIVSFNAQLRQNDGVLVICLQSSLNCSATQALNYLSDFCEYCISILTTSKRITFENIGFFYVDFENNICFEPQNNTNFLTNSFGLLPISIKIIEAETVTKKQLIYSDKTHPKNIQKAIVKTKNKKNYSKLIISSLISVTIFSLLALVISNTKINGNLRASLFGTNIKNNYNTIIYPNLKLQSVTAQNITYVADANGIASINLEPTKTLFVNINVVNLIASTKKIIIKSNLNSSKNYSQTTNNTSFKIVLGCFSVAQNAERLLNTLQKNNIAASISPKNNRGLYIVSSGNFASKQDAADQLTELLANYPGAWIKNPN